MKKSVTMPQSESTSNTRRTQVFTLTGFVAAALFVLGSMNANSVQPQAETPFASVTTPVPTLAAAPTPTPTPEFVAVPTPTPEFAAVPTPTPEFAAMPPPPPTFAAVPTPTPEFVAVKNTAIKAI